MAKQFFQNGERFINNGMYLIKFVVGWFISGNPSPFEKISFKAWLPWKEGVFANFYF
jgi:hypothetical protein